MARSDDLVNWQDCGVVAERPIQNGQGCGTCMMESPFVFKHGDLYYLVYNQAEWMKYIISKDPLDFNNNKVRDFVDGVYNFEMVDIEIGLVAFTNCCYYPNLRFGVIKFDRNGLVSLDIHRDKHRL